MSSSVSSLESLTFLTAGLGAGGGMGGAAAAFTGFAATGFAATGFATTGFAATGFVGARFAVADDLVATLLVAALLVATAHLEFAEPRCRLGSQDPHTTRLVGAAHQTRYYNSNPMSQARPRLGPVSGRDAAEAADAHRLRQGGAPSPPYNRRQP